ncbi:MAG: hypothetical protein JWN95_2259 [Frankiales bacterium]|nr:hypothetical protein [Frankiales bacterium]
MTSAQVLLDGYDRVQQVVHKAVQGLTIDQLTAQLGPDANTIAWLTWHLTRVQDDHLAEARGIEQVWTAADWADRFQLPFFDSATGYGQTSAEVAAVRVSADLLLGYYDATHDSSVEYLRTLTDDDLAVVIDTAWDPPVTLGVRLISVLSDDLQHAGQAAFIRGLVL